LSLNNLKISQKLALVFSLVVLTIVGLGVTVFFQLQNIDRATAVANRDETSMSRLKDVQRSIDQQQSNARAYLAVREPRYLERITESQATFNEVVATLREGLGDVPVAIARLDRLEAAVGQYQNEFQRRQLALAANPATRAEAEETIRSGEAQRYMEPISTVIEEMRSAQEQRATAAHEMQKRSSSVANMALAGGVGLSMLLAVFFGWMLTRAVATPVVALTETMRKLAGGDNTVTVPGGGRKDEIGAMAAAVLTFKDAAIAKIQLEGESADARRQSEEERARNEDEKARLAEEDRITVEALGRGLKAMAEGDLTQRFTAEVPSRAAELKANFNSAIEQLQTAMKVVVANVAAIRSGSGEISQAADDLSRRTEQQAASLEETAAALDQITATVNKTADGARQASDVVQEARGDAQKSGEVVRDAVSAMTAIEQSSQQISQIIGVIDEIAFQTNLLALNAGVEAARAGDAGRGFAVVASEVRALAQRSAEAAKEIKTLISASTTQVSSGVQLVGQTGEALNRIVERVAEINGLVTEIAASAQEQATGLQQVNTAVNQMDQVTQQNAAMVEESTAASHSLAQEAEALASSVARFNIGEEASVPVVRPAPRQAAKAQPRTVTALKTVGGPGQSAAHKPVTEQDEWEEF
tara:strand:+ start:625 stop:2559 length:1935 start_codon:yes stop_codon:yes gene_type:complete